MSYSFFSTNVYTWLKGNNSRQFRYNESLLLNWDKTNHTKTLAITAVATIDKWKLNLSNFALVLCYIRIKGEVGETKT